MSWGAFLSIVGVILLLAMVLIPAPSRGPSGRGVVPADCLTSLAGAFAVGVVTLVAVFAIISHVRRGYYSTPRRDVALASLIMFPVLAYLWPLACFPWHFVVWRPTAGS